MPDPRTSITLTNNQCHNLTVLLNIFGGDMNIFKQMSRCIAIIAGAIAIIAGASVHHNMHLLADAPKYARANGRTKYASKAALAMAMRA